MFVFCQLPGPWVKLGSSIAKPIPLQEAVLEALLTSILGWLESSAMAAVGLSAHTHSAVGGRVGGASTLGAVPAAQHRPAACSRPEERPVRISAAAAAPPTRRRRASQQCRAAAGNGSSNGSSCNGSNPRTADVALPAPPSSSETARTVVDLVAHGTLCTTGEDGTPLGTYASYVLDEGGQPVLRLRADAVHTANLRRSPRCSLFVQPGEHPTRLLARVTLIGEVEPVPEEVAAKAADLHNALHAGNVGVDAPRPSDLHYRLKVDRVFYVGELAGASQAEVISGDEYRGAEADPLRTCAVALVHHMNTNRAEDVLRMRWGARGWAGGAGATLQLWEEGEVPALGLLGLPLLF